ncbi:hypothetical protein GLOIN_2v383687 [Rhizophagus irregularis DAOM 181602=DAOM 197198]|uniref:Serine-threonine/tyrosine-protein kinase catalytic domain-containing protein n=1 Tax=Rhizophagus irregularis (strain DAOM 181602 / DAOM 197198 / MUCL 43194) TaxID=747089 RepID=A0A2P4QZJ7_RHIID|nr:hypothetical protein GLOIN_2v383687 [Rhizophagus irregularis DAOM 181602=DAOM 197198]POG83080.1 hypothetical protein GLOIN_2v383687 [Rhizophagus irregularis DAOM 181602=DAOM 197198]|eukprot:XP_025189946.1 hypothetical protein GLOIN_2v383687 [Rhizophagus irregularis DAOM 181602=DAOM 197198]
MNQTPEEYLKLYKLCWNPDPDVRTPINKIFTKLGKMSDSNNEQTNNNISSVISNDGFGSLFIPDNL